MKPNDNQNITSESMLRDMENRYAWRLYNEQFYGKYHDEFVALEEFVCQTIADTDSANAPGGSRGVGGAVPSDVGMVTDNENLTHFNTGGSGANASNSPEVSNTGQYGAIKVPPCRIFPLSKYQTIKIGTL